MTPSIAITISEESQVGEARRMAISIAKRLQFDETRAGEVAIIVTEAARNILRHAGNGEILLGAFHDADEGLEILAMDSGPGIADVSRCFDDGYSTSSTPGTGLGAIRRLTSSFDLYSLPNSGTALLMRCVKQEDNASDKQKSKNLEHLSCRCGVTMLPKPGEEFCGDGWGATRYENVYQFMVCDGLGHGPQAATVSSEATRIFQQEQHRTPAQILQAVHSALRATRGAAMAITEVDTMNNHARFAGIGNIAASIQTPDGSTNMVSHNGIVGAEMRKVQEFSYPWPANATLVMHSDGLASQWQLNRYPQLLARHPALIAGVLYRDFKRGRDDLTVLAARFS